jgi:hypothetical protein
VVARWRDDIYLTIASIADFQPFVTSGVVPPPANPLTISQPCIRLNDLDSVGRSGRHLTLFEMMAHHAFNTDEHEVYWKEETVAYHHELLTKDDYEVYVDKNIFKPLEMHRSYFDATPYHLLSHRSHSYYVREGKRTSARFDVNTGITVSNGGLNAPFGNRLWLCVFSIRSMACEAVSASFQHCPAML